MGSQWAWCALVVALLLVISLEAANGQGNGNGNGQGNGNGIDQGNGNGNGNGNGQGNGNGNGQGNGNGNGGQPPYYPPPSQTPPYYPPSSYTPPPPPPPPSYTPPPYVTPPLSTPPSSPPPPYVTPPPQTPPSSTPPPPPQTPPTTPPRDESIEYYMVSPVERTGQEQANCTVVNACQNKILTCPAECSQRVPRNNKIKGCYIDCSSKCEATCKWRKPSCDNYGSLCYDPRFVGGDGNMFYFHGSKGSDFAIVTDEHLQINAHFIGTRPAGRTRDFTWVQALSIMFDTHSLVISAKRVSKWDDKVESLIVKWDGEMINIPTDGHAEWRINTENRVVIERTDDYNTVRAIVSGLVQVDTRVVPIGEQENKVHHYHIPGDDAFAHLETEFKFFKLSASVEGVLGRTYQPGFESPMKMGLAMPMMGGEDKYQTPSLNSPLCKACKFQRPSRISMVTAL